MAVLVTQKQQQTEKKLYNITILLTLIAYYQCKPKVKCKVYSKSRFDDSKKIILSGDVETNPGPVHVMESGPLGKKFQLRPQLRETHSSVEIVMYNCRCL